MSKSPRIVNVNITFRNLAATDALQKYGEDKLKSCIQKYVHRDTEAHLVLLVEKNRQIAEVSFHVDGADFKTREESGDMYSSIDSLVATLSGQLRKHKEKITSHH